MLTKKYYKGIHKYRNIEYANILLEWQVKDYTRKYDTRKYDIELDSIDDIDVDPTDDS